MQSRSRLTLLVGGLLLGAGIFSQSGAATASMLGSASEIEAGTTGVVVLGDSVGTGAGCECETFGSILARGIDGGALHLDAHDGLMSSDLVKALDDPASVESRDVAVADIVTITIGANDFDETRAGKPGCEDATCYQSDLASMRTNVGHILDVIHTRAPESTKVVLTGYWNVFLDGSVGQSHGPTYQRTSDALTVEVNNALADAAHNAHVRYVDLYTPFKGDGSVDDTSLLAPDGDHPSVLGHQVIAGRISGVLDQDDHPHSVPAQL